MGRYLYVSYLNYINLFVGSIMKNFAIFIFFSVVIYLLSMLVISWDESEYIDFAGSSNMSSPVAAQKNTFEWNEEFSFPTTLYARADYIPVVTGKTFYVDPAVGSMSNDGSLEAPWSTLQEVFEQNLIQHYRYKETPYKKGSEKVVVNPDAPVKGGDEIILFSGDHGSVRTGKGGFYMGEGKFLTIKSGDSSRPVISNIEIESGSFIYLEGLEFANQGVVGSTASIVDIKGHSHHGEASDIIIRNCEIKNVGDSWGWSAATWKRRAASGISIFGDNVVIRDCKVEGVALGIGITGDNSIVIGNDIIQFCSDGMRGNGSNLVFENNFVCGSYKVDDNHDDGFQAFLTGGKSFYENVILKNNVIIQSVDRKRKLLGDFQGIGCFDGPYKNWKIIRNKVITDHWHGIVVMGGIDCLIDDNLVLPLNYGAKEGPPWISLVDGKKGERVEGCSVTNNRSMKYKLEDGVMKKNNMTLKSRGEVEGLSNSILAKNKVAVNDF